jgi:hypothetical protein
LLVIPGTVNQLRLLFFSDLSYSARTEAFDTAGRVPFFPCDVATRPCEIVKTTRATARARFGSLAKSIDLKYGRHIYLKGFQPLQPSWQP